MFLVIQKTPELLKKLGSEMADGDFFLSTSADLEKIFVSAIISQEVQHSEIYVSVSLALSSLRLHLCPLVTTITLYAGAFLLH